MDPPKITIRSKADETCYVKKFNNKAVGKWSWDGDCKVTNQHSYMAPCMLTVAYGGGTWSQISVKIKTASGW